MRVVIVVVRLSIDRLYFPVFDLHEIHSSKLIVDRAYREKLQAEDVEHKPNILLKTNTNKFFTDRLESIVTRHAFIMKRIYANIIFAIVKCILTVINGFQFVLIR